MDRIVDFQQLRDEHLSILPPKIARLHHQYRAGTSVPEKGFVVFWPVVQEILDFNQGREEWLLPSGLRQGLLAPYQRTMALYGREMRRTAVRGALSLEDDAHASYAGGSWSATNIMDADGYLQAVLTCVRKSFAGKMNIYERHHGLDGEKRLFILVQEMAYSDLFAVVFTRNPLTGSSDEVLVQATLGGGEPLTSGHEAGHVFVLNRAGDILRADIGAKERMALGFTPAFWLRELVKFALKVETIEGGVPQDEEIAIRVDVDFSSGHCVDFTLVQTRPITTVAVPDPALYPRAQAIIQAESFIARSLTHLRGLGLEPTGDAYTDQNIVELLTPHPSRMAFGMFTHIFAHGDAGIKLGRNQMGYDIGPEMEWGFFELIAGQPRCSIVHDALTYRIKGIPLTDYFEGFVRHYLDRIRQDRKLANYPEIGLYEQNPSLAFLAELYNSQKARQYRKCYERFFAGIRRLESVLGEECRRVCLPDMERYVAQGRSLDIDTLNVSELVGAIRRDLDYLRTEACVWYVKIARLGFYAHARLKHALESDSILGLLTGGLEGVPTIESSIALFDVKTGCRSQSEFMARYGHLGFHELEIAGPRYHENPAAIEILIARLTGDPRQELAQRKEEYRRAINSLPGSLCEDVAAARQYLALREHVKFAYLKLYDLIRRKLLCLERRLSWGAGDIFFLDPLELGLLLEKSGCALELVEARKKERRVVADIIVPKVLFTEELNLIDTVDTAVLCSVQSLSGQAMSPYVAEGRAVVILDPNDPLSLERMHPGCILVTPSADPAWAPIVTAIGKGGGLITEVGGPLAHGAIVCREMQYAGVQEIEHATRIIKEGERVRVDGRDGKVYLLDRER